MAEIRPYEPRDLVQLAALVNAHVATATPGWTVPGAWIAERLERDPDDYVVDPWVRERSTLVAVERERVVGACQVRRYAEDERVSDSYRGVGEIGWLYVYPAARDTGAELVAAAVRQLDEWRVSRRYACAGGLGPDIYGVPDCWPHVERLLREAGFDDAEGRDEVLYVGRLADLGEAGEPPLPGLRVTRETFDGGVAFVAWRDEERVAELRVELPDPSELPALAGWADGWGIRVEEALRRRGVATWLVREAAAWLRLAGRDRLVWPLVPEEDAGEEAFWRALGLVELTCIRRGWKLSRS
jgi:GNAT superfamily N-acetyltransferase